MIQKISVEKTLQESKELTLKQVPESEQLLLHTEEGASAQQPSLGDAAGRPARLRAAQTTPHIPPRPAPPVRVRAGIDSQPSCRGFPSREEGRGTGGSALGACRAE